VAPRQAASSPVDEQRPASQSAVTPHVRSRYRGRSAQWHSFDGRHTPVNERSSLDDTPPTANDRSVAAS
jgi:hypothetical protein